MVKFHIDKSPNLFHILPTPIFSYYPSGLARYGFEFRWLKWSIRASW